MTRKHLRLVWLLVAAYPLALALGRAAYLGDPWIDFPSELYLSWRLSEGELLYRDLAYHYGPFPPYALAALMKLFGPTRGTALAANFVVFLLVLGAFGLAFRRFVTETANAAALLAATSLAGFNLSAVIYLNYNFLTPYRHGLTYGLLFSLLALAAFVEATRRPRKSELLSFLCGLAAGGALLCKVEFAFALGASLLPCWLLGKGPRRSLAFPAGLALALAAGLLPLVAGGFGPGEAAAALLRTWLLPLDPGLRALPIYTDSFENFGARELGHRLLQLAAWAGALGGGAWCLKRIHRRKERLLLFLGGVAAALLTAGFLFPAPLRSLSEWSLFSPWICLAAALLLAARRRWLEAMLFGFAFLLPLKVLARPTLAEAGFALALPAALAAFLLAFDTAPAALGWAKERARAWRAYVVLLALPQAAFAWFESSLRQGTMPILVNSRAGDLRMAPEMALVTSDLVSTLKERFPGARTVTVLPEGTYVNLVLGKPTPFPYLWIQPDQFVLHGEAEILRRLEAKPADIVVLLPRYAPVPGFGEFREGYGRKLVESVRASYRREEGLSERLRHHEVEIYSRKGAP